MFYILNKSNNYLIITNELDSEIVFMCSIEDARISRELGTPNFFRLYDVFGISLPFVFIRSELKVDNLVFETDDLLYEFLDSSTGTTDTLNNENTSNKKSTLDLDASNNFYPNVTAVRTHTTDINNPHAVNKTQVGLSNVDNTSDINKPISSVTSTAIGLKQDVLVINNIDTNITRTIALTDIGLTLILTNPNPITITIPKNSTTQLPIGFWFKTTQQNIGVVTVGGVGLTFVTDCGLNSSQGETRKYIKTDVDTWTIEGNKSTTQINGIVLLVSNWTLVSGFYEYNILNSTITSRSIVDVIPTNDSISILKLSEPMPSTLSANGSVKIYTTNLPTDNITVTINIVK